MKISIDTSTDSKDDIRKAIKLLQSVVEHEAQSRDIFSSPGAELFGSSQPAAPAEPAANPVTAFGNLFGDNAPAQQPASTIVPEEKKKQPQIEFY